MLLIRVERDHVIPDTEIKKVLDHMEIDIDGCGLLDLDVLGCPGFGLNINTDKQTVTIIGGKSDLTCVTDTARDLLLSHAAQITA